MYTEYWQLREKPFENTPDPRFLYYSRQHEEAIMRMLYAIQAAKGAALLSGEYGCGKTLTMRKIIKELGESGDQFNIAYLTNPRWTAEELLQEVLYQLEIPHKSNSKIDMIHSLNDYLFEKVKLGNHTLLIVDEAQVIEDPGTLEELRLLLNFQLDDRFLLTLFLVGQPELIPLVKSLPQLNQRIAIRYHLSHLSLDETRAYILHRLKVAGAARQIFEQSAYEEIFRYSGGVPRIINNICDLALVIGFGKQIEVISGELVRSIKESEGEGF